MWFLHFSHGQRAMNMYRFTNSELADIHFIYGLADGNGRADVRLYRERYPTRRQPNHQTFARVHQNLLHEGFLATDVPTPAPILRHMWFQQDGAPSHYARHAREHLDRTFPNRWIGRGGPVAWPPRSPDLSPLDFSLGCYEGPRARHACRFRNGPGHTDIHRCC
ncbi:DUF4817 domain-containing protein [Trichonephila clavipes]|nr:DUF4817 domain-containing protein [Trichonephila clavipes]